MCAYSVNKRSSLNLNSHGTASVNSIAKITESHLGMDRFHFFFKRSFRYENDDKKLITKQSFLKTIVLNENRFKKRSFSKRSFLKS